MTLETFFEKFDLFAGLPDAVAKMREIVLELAVCGRLSECLPEDQNDQIWRAFLSSHIANSVQTGSDRGRATRSYWNH
jgi:hypothetical protein